MTDLNFTGSGLDDVRRIAEMPLWPDTASSAEVLDLIRQEAVIRANLMAYIFAYDAGDVDAVMEYFIHDCVLSNPRGEYVGLDAVRANYENVFRILPSQRHSWANVTIRFPQGADEAYLAAYHYGVLAAPDEQVHFGALGTDVQYLIRIDTSWKIKQRRIAFQVGHELSGWTDQALPIAQSTVRPA